MAEGIFVQLNDEDAKFLRNLAKLHDDLNPIEVAHLLDKNSTLSQLESKIHYSLISAFKMEALITPHVAELSKEKTQGLRLGLRYLEELHTYGLDFVKYIDNDAIVYDVGITGLILLWLTGLPQNSSVCGSSTAKIRNKSDLVQMCDVISVAMANPSKENAEIRRKATALFNLTLQHT